MSISKTGYLSPAYAQSLSAFGNPLALQHSQAWILKRPIAATPYFDGLGCYPIFTCQDWSAVGRDLEELTGQLVSLALVTDPFGDYSPQDLETYFTAVARPYKKHFIVDLSRPQKEFVDAHHQRNARKALQQVEVEICATPAQYLDEWTALYAHLIERHNIQGIAQFSKSAFAIQLSIPGLVMCRASWNGQVAGMLLWYIQGAVAYYHLGAYSSMGYTLNASFAMFWTLLDYFRSLGLKWLSLGAGAGVDGNENDGLTRFKRGWSTGVRTAYFCGRIFDPKKYQELLRARNLPTTVYFPAYRSHEI